MKFSKKAMKKFTKETLIEYTDGILSDIETAQLHESTSLLERESIENSTKHVASCWDIKPKDIKKLIKMREISKWLELVTGENDENRGVDFSSEFSGEGYRFATNGFTIHIAKSDKPLRLSPSSKAFETNRWEDEITENMPINPEMLIEALDIFKDDLQVIISISKDEYGHPKMLIKGINENADLSAWIMGMHLIEEDEMGEGLNNESD